MPTDTAPIQTTATVITSGAEAIRTAREFAASIADGVIERDRSGAVPVRELAALDALPGGDHEIIVGRVRHAETSANPNGPLVFFRGSYASLTDQALPACG